jgi:hypothetical protein
MRYGGLMITALQYGLQLLCNGLSVRQHSHYVYGASWQGYQYVTDCLKRNSVCYPNLYCTRVNVQV